MIIRVLNQAAKAIPKDQVYAATDSEEIAKVVNNYGYDSFLIKDDCKTGSDRVAEAAKSLKQNIIVNLQGDEPLMDPELILNAIQQKLKFPDHTINCAYFDNGNGYMPYIVTNCQDNIMYISREVIPYGSELIYERQIGLYVFDRYTLTKYYGADKNKTSIEKTEDIEILRLLENNEPIKICSSNKKIIPVDKIEHIKTIEYILQNNKNND